MVATVAFNGTNITLANGTTGFDKVKLSSGGSTPSVIDETNGVFLTGTGAASIKVSDQRIILWFDNGSGIDFETTHAGKCVYIWCAFLGAGLLRDRDAVGAGLSIVLGSSSSDYDVYPVAGADYMPIGDNGFVRFMIDPNKVGDTAENSGTFDRSSVQFFGMIGDTQPNTAKFDNMIIDRIDYGYGLTVKGTSTTDGMVQDILDAENLIANKWGILRVDEGQYFLKGGLILGDTAANSDMTEVNSSLTFEAPVYYDGSSVVTCLPSSFYELSIVGQGAGGGINGVQFGKKVGSGDSARGRNGLSIASAGPPVDITFTDGNADEVLIYGTTLRNISGTLQFGADNVTANEFIGNTIDQCSQFDPVASVVMRNGTISGYTSDTDGALLWNESIDIKNYNFIANADDTNDPAAIEHPSNAGTPYDYINLQFSGNDFDINNTSGGALAIAPSFGSNMSGDPDKTDAVTINSVGVITTIEGVPQDAEWRLYEDSGIAGELGTVELGGIESKVTSADILYNDSYVSDTDVVLQVFASGYEEYQFYFKLRDAPQTISVELSSEENI